MRPFRFAIHLREFGWEPTVMTIPFPGVGLTDKEARLLKDIRVLNIASPIDHTFRSESHLGAPPGMGDRPRRSAPPPWIATLDRQFPIDTWLPLFVARFGTMLRQAAEVDPHVVWATGNPWSALMAGQRLSKRLGVPYIADFRDPWTLSEAPIRQKWPWAQRIDEWAERRVVAGADALMFQTRRMADAYQQHYAELTPRNVVIGNSFDPDVFDDPISVDRRFDGEDAPSGSSSMLRIGFFGRFRAISPAAPIIDALVEFRKQQAALVERIRIHSFGPLSEADAAQARAHGLERQFVCEDIVPLERALSTLRRFDLLLVIEDVHPRHVIPAKIFEYLAAGRPILSLSTNLEVAEMLRRTGAGVQIEDTAAAVRLLNDCLRAREAGRPLPVPFDPKPEEIMRHDARTTTRAFARTLDSLTGR